MRRAGVLATGVLAAGLGTALADSIAAPRLDPVRAVTVEGVLQTEDGRSAAQDLSGIACKPTPAGSARRLCLVVNDSDRFAQLATIEDGRIVAGPTIPLLGDAPSRSTLGSSPLGLACSAGEAGFENLDGEGVAYAEPFFYVVGSHGCSRRNKAHVSRYILARLRIDDQGRVVDASGHAADPSRDALDLVETTHRLADALRAAETAGAHFGNDLEANGLNVEGLAVVGGALYAGLRAPSLDGTAYIVGVSTAALFSRDDPPPPLAPTLIPLALGEGVGIRDLAPLPDGRLLVLAGPAQDQPEIAYALFALAPREGGLVRLATLGDPEGVCTPRPPALSGKPEAVLPLGRDGDRLRVLILFDSLPNGAPCEYAIPLR